MLTSSRETLQLNTREEEKFRLRERESGLSQPSETPRFLVRPESQEARRHAIEQFEQEKLEGPSLPVLEKGADVLLQHKERQLALVLLREAMNRDSRSISTLRKLFSLMKVDEWTLVEREKLAETLCDTTKQAADTVIYAKIQYEKGDLDRALDLYFDAAAQITNEDGSVFEIYKDIGNIFVRMNDLDGAEEYYHKAYALHPDSDLLHVNLGTLEIQRQDWGTARDRFRSALSLNAKNDKAWVGLALAHYHLGDVDLAFANLGNAVDICPANRTAVHLMAAWGEKHMRYPEAIEALQSHLGEVSFDEEMSLALIHLFCLRQEYGFALLEIERVLLWNPFREDLYELEERLRNMTRDDN